MADIEGAGIAKSIVSSVPTLDVKIVNPKAKLPERAHEGDAGLDLAYCGELTWLHPGQVRRFPTGVAVAIPPGYVGLTYVRSGLGVKNNITLANSVGVIDSTYRGELLVFLTNHGEEAVAITRGQRIAQLVVSPILLPEVNVVENLSETERGEGGFGSTGA